MRKVWAGITFILGILCIGISLAMEYIKRRKNAVMSISVIGANDGPTSVFLAGTVGDLRPYQIGLAAAGLLALLASLILFLKNSR